MKVAIQVKQKRCLVMKSTGQSCIQILSLFRKKIIRAKILGIISYNCFNQPWIHLYVATQLVTPTRGSFLWVYFRPDDCHSESPARWLVAVCAGDLLDGPAAILGRSRIPASSHVERNSAFGGRSETPDVSRSRCVRFVFRQNKPIFRFVSQTIAFNGFSGSPVLHCF